MSKLAPLASLLLAALCLPAPAAAQKNLLVPRDFPTIGDALAAAVSGDRIVVNGGTYQECPTISGRSDLTLFGKKDPVIDLTGCAAGLVIADGARVTVEGFTFIGATLQAVLVEAAASEVFVQKCTIVDPSGDPGRSLMLNGVTIDGATDVTVDDVTIRGATAHAVHVLDATRPVVKRSAIRDGAGEGIRVDLAVNAKIEKNKLEHLLGPAIRLFHEGGTGATGGAVASLVLANRIRDTPGAGIVVGGSDNLIENNSVDRAGGIGIEALPNGGASIYRKNAVQAPAGLGVLAGGTGDTFERLTVTDPGTGGILVTGDGNTFLASKVDGAMQNAFTVGPDASGNGFRKCLALKSRANGFLVEGTLNTFVQTKASKSGAFDLHDAAGAATTNVYTDCNFKRANVPLPKSVELPDF